MLAHAYFSKKNPPKNPSFVDVAVWKQVWNGRSIQRINERPGQLNTGLVMQQQPQHTSSDIYLAFNLIMLAHLLFKIVYIFS